MAYGYYRTGTVSTVAGSKTVTGSGVDFVTAKILPGARLFVSGLDLFEVVAKVTDASTLELADAAATTVTDAAYRLEKLYFEEDIASELSGVKVRLGEAIDVSGDDRIIRLNADEDGNAVIYYGADGDTAANRFRAGVLASAPTTYVVQRFDGTTWHTIYSATTDGTYSGISAGPTGATGATGAAPWTSPDAWVTTTAYVAAAPSSCVTNGGSCYVCMVPHTAGTFATDLAAGYWRAIAVGGGTSVADGDYGDVLVSGGGSVWTVDDAVPETKRFTPSGTGVVTRTIQAKLREIASVKDFGATGDGSTDDTAPLNLAIAALNSGAISRLHFPAGAYKTTAALSTITRSGVSLTGDGPRLSYIYPAAAVNALIFSSATPTTARISDIYISGLGVNYGAVTAPAAGIALVMTRADRVYVDNFDVRNAFAGVEIQGGADQHYSNITIAGATSWSAVQSGSYSVRLSYLSETTEVPSEIFFDNFNFKGYMSAYGATAYQAHCIIAECFDGFFMANGHVGFSSSAALFVNPQNNSALSCYNLQCDNVYFDGNGGGLSSGYMVWVSGSSTPNVAELSFDNCTFRNWAGTALWTDAASLKDLRISGCSFTDNGKLAAGVVSASGFGVDNCNFRNNNTANQSSDCISLQYCSAGVVSGNRILSGAYTHTNGVNVISASDIVIANNVLGTHSADITVSSSCSRVKSRGNLKNGSVPTVASAATISIPAGYDVVSISGTTGISTIDGPTQYGDTVTLHFSGVLTVADGTGNVKLAGTFTSTADSTLTLMYLGSAWTEVSRAIV